MKLHKDFAFTQPEHDFGPGMIYAKLRGTMKEADKANTSQESPYELLVWFLVQDSGTPISCEVNLYELALTNIEDDVRIAMSSTGNDSFDRSSDGNYLASVSTKGLELSYATHELEFSYSFGDGCFSDLPPSTVSFEFRKNYEKRRITFWDALMGV